MSHKVHPAATVFPLMSDAAYQALKADIETYGQREPVVFYRGQLIDGRNRARACEELGIPISDCEIPDDADPIAYVVSANLHRRHLKESQRATVAAKMKKLYEPAAKERKKANLKKGNQKTVVANLPLRANGKTRDHVAALVNVSGKSVDHASAVLECGSIELIEAVERGELAVSKAAAVAKSKPKREQLAAAKAKAPKKSPLNELKHWWEKADETQKCLFRNWIDGKL